MHSSKGENHIAKKKRRKDSIIQKDHKIKFKGILSQPHGILYTSSWED
jgi:hypothetical protein